MTEILAPCADEDLNKELTDASFIKFKEKRKSLSGWYRLGMANLKREDNLLVQSVTRLHQT